MSVFKSGEPQTWHSGMLPGYVIMKGTISNLCVPYKPGNFFDQLSEKKLLDKAYSVQTVHCHKTARYMEGTSTYTLYTISNAKRIQGWVGGHSSDPSTSTILDLLCSNISLICNYNYWPG
jgi:hypothetical protein